MHQQRDRVIKPYFSQKELLTYLQYCRQIKPKFTKSAGEKLANEFVRLRQNDVTKKNQSYRITIRQLESIIWLSEALAKLHADDEIRDEYVDEAVRLLSKSII